MKKTLFYLFLAISFAQTLNAQVVNIPDANFKSALLQNPKINTNGDTEIQISEAVVYSDYIFVNSKNIKDLTGIETFINLKILYCAENQLTTLDVSKNTTLTRLDCFNNQLTTLDVSKNFALTRLECFNNQLTTLDVSKNITLTDLYCNNNQLTTLDVSKNFALTDLYCDDNQLTTLDVSKNIALAKLYCARNQLITLDVSKNIALIELSIFRNKFTTLDVSKNLKLAYLDCSYNQLTTMDVSKNIMLNAFGCDANQLTNLNLKNGANAKLRTLFVTDNPLLKCIQVDNPNKIGTNWKKDSTATYSANCSVSTNDNTATTPQFNLYPNPTNHTLHIDWQGDATPIAITLYNSIGEAVKTQQLPQQGSINIADLPRGMYLCRINNANYQSQTIKVVIE